MKIHKVFFKFFCLAFAGIIITNLPICRADDDLGDFFEDSTQEIIPLKIKKQNSDDLDDFFSEDEPSPEPQNTISPESTIQPSKYFINGSISFKAGIRYDYHPDVPTTSKHEGWSDLKTQIDLEFGTKLFDAWDFFISGSAFYNQVYTLKDKDNYTNTFLDEYEKELELEKLF